MFNLIKNEWIKIFSRPGTYVMIGLTMPSCHRSRFSNEIRGVSQDT